MSPQKLERILKDELPQWEQLHTTLPQNPTQERREIFREFLFEDFDQAMEFMVAAKPYFNFIPHHPRWQNIWRTVWIYLCTWDGGYQITYKDIIVARNLERLYQEDFYTKYNYQERNIDRVPVDPEKQAFIDALKTKISEGKVKEVFQNLDNYFIRNDRFTKPNQLIQLQDQFINLERDQEKGILLREHYDVGRAKVVDELLNELLDVRMLLQH